MNCNKSYRIGIDLGGTNIKVGIVNHDYKIVTTYSVPTLPERPYTDVIYDMAQACLIAIKQSGIAIEEIAALGVGSPGYIDAENGVVVFAANLNWENVPVLEELRKYFQLPMGLSNDANCAALGEVIAGAAKNYDNAVMITLGTGICGGIVLGRKIVEGGHPGGAELGHTTLVSGGEPCTCGRRGCFEAYSSATALIRDARCAASEHSESLLNLYCKGDWNRIDGIAPFACAQAGDTVAQEGYRSLYLLSW